VLDALTELKDSIKDLKTEFVYVKHEISDIKHEISDMKHEISDMKHEISDIKNEISDMKHEIKHEISDMKQEISNVKQYVLRLGDSSHFHNRHTSKIIAAISYPRHVLNTENEQYSTAHNVFYNGIYATVTTAHSDTSTSSCSIVPSELNESCENLDVSVAISCPKTDGLSKPALNISSPAVLINGDAVIMTGYKFYHPKFLTRTSVGHLMGEYGKDFHGVHWSTSIYANSNEYYIEGKLLTQMSGSAVANSCGYVGMAHAIDDEKITLIIPAKDVIACIESKKDKLKYCGLHEVIEPVVWPNC
jgi:cell division protein FtsL